jgi:Fe-S-cluster containining protein
MGVEGKDSMVTKSEVNEHKFIKNYLNTKRNRYYRACYKVLDHFECKRCGQCCKIPVHVTPKEVERIARQVKLHPREFCVDVKGLSYLKHPCPFFEESNKQCKIYNIRPEVCRLYPFETSRPILQAIDLCPLAGEIKAFIDENKSKIIDLIPKHIDRVLEERINKILPDDTDLEELRATNEEISDLTSKFIEAHFNVEGKPIKNIKLWVEVVESMADILDERSFA